MCNGRSERVATLSVNEKPNEKLNAWYIRSIVRLERLTMYLTR